MLTQPALSIPSSAAAKRKEAEKPMAVDLKGLMDLSAGKKPRAVLADITVRNKT